MLFFIHWSLSWFDKSVELLYYDICTNRKNYLLMGWNMITIKHKFHQQSLKFYFESLKKSLSDLIFEINNKNFIKNKEIILHFKITIQCIKAWKFGQVFRCWKHMATDSTWKIWLSLNYSILSSDAKLWTKNSKKNRKNLKKKFLQMFKHHNKNKLSFKKKNYKKNRFNWVVSS